MKVIKFEGTPEEFQVVSHLFTDSSDSQKTGEEDKLSSELPIVVPKDAIIAMLTRIPPSNGQLAVYHTLADGKLEINEFYKRTGRMPKQMRGVLGTLGRRINNTEEIHQAGLPGNTLAVLEWSKYDGNEYISLTSDAIDALKELKII